VPLTTTAELINDLQGVLTGNASELLQTALWNGGFYLWRSGISLDMQAGIDKAGTLFSSGVVRAKLEEISSLLSILSL
jgi:anthranilate phosphoribosyltransferase